MERKGLYIVFEGLPKCGKSTQVGLLYEDLKLRLPEREIVLTKEPGGTEIAGAIRKLVQATKFQEEMDPTCEAYLYAASRAQALRRAVVPAVKTGAIVLADRSKKSSEAIQGGARRLGLGVVREINKIATEVIEPDATFFIDTDPGVCHNRAKDAYDGTDKFEAMDLEFFRAIRQGYLVFESEMETIPGDQSIEAIHGLILTSVLRLV